MNYTNYGDNPFQPGVVAHDLYTSDQLIAGDFPKETQPIIVIGGPYARGTVLGMVSAQSVESAPGAANTGNGAIGNLSRSAGSLTGSYAVVATSPTVFSVTDPEGNALPNATAGTAYSQSGINFLITAGSTAFAVGDSFAVTTVDAAGQYKQSVATATDGSQTPSAILVDTTTVVGPVNCGAYLTGEFNERRITYDPSWTIATLRAALAPRSIFLKSSISGTPPY